MPVDPGKTAFYNSLIKDIEKVSKGKEHPVALDAASAGFKNRAFFLSFTYIGADIDFNALLTGIQNIQMTMLFMLIWQNVALERHLRI